MVEENNFDIIVIGSGPGGYASAFRAADLGKRVLLIERDKELGGVCLNRGCIPSKTLLHISKVIHEAKELSKAGVTFSKPEINLNKVRHHKNQIISKMNTGISQMAKARKVERIEGLQFSTLMMKSRYLMIKQRKNFLLIIA